MKEEKKLSLQLKELVGKQSVRSFAIKCGVDPKSMGKYLDGNKGITLTTLERIATASNVSLGWLIGGESSKHPHQPATDSGQAAAEPGAWYKSLLDEIGKQPAEGDGNLRLIIQWLLEEYHGNAAGQGLLFRHLPTLFPTFEDFLNKHEKKTPAAAQASQDIIKKKQDQANG